MGRILLVEDDPWSQRLVADLLQLHGHDVATAIGVADARERLQPDLDLVLLDIHIPGGGGELLLRWIRHRDRGMPVIALTASAMTGDRERLLRLGFTAYMSKPIDVPSFADTITKYMRGKA